MEVPPEVTSTWRRIWEQAGSGRPAKDRMQVETGAEETAIRTGEDTAPLPVFHLPESNPFIATDFSLKDDVPVLSLLPK
jgi:hypothetical protein